MSVGFSALRTMPSQNECLQGIGRENDLPNPEIQYPIFCRELFTYATDTGIPVSATCANYAQVQTQLFPFWKGSLEVISSSPSGHLKPAQMLALEVIPFECPAPCQPYDFSVRLA